MKTLSGLILNVTSSFASEIETDTIEWLTCSKGTLNEKFYEELGLQSLQHRLIYRKLSYFYKFYKNELLQYLFRLIHLRSSEHSTSMGNVPFSKVRHNFLKKYFFPVSHHAMEES